MLSISVSIFLAIADADHDADADANNDDDDDKSNNVPHSTAQHSAAQRPCAEQVHRRSRVGSDTGKSALSHIHMTPQQSKTL